MKLDDMRLPLGDDDMFLVHDPSDSRSPYSACGYHVEDLSRVDYDRIIYIEPFSAAAACCMCLEGDA